MRYLIIGLGIYGSNLAIDLASMGHEVIGADISATIVEGIKDYVTTTYILDATDEASLLMLPLTNVDIVIVAIGENFGASVRTVAMLKKAGVKHIYARAADQLHEAILEGFHVDRILTPEQRAAHDLVLEMGLDSRVEALPVEPDSFVAKFFVPQFFIGLKYADIDFVHTYHVALVTVSRSKDARNIVGMESTGFEPLDLQPDTLVQKGDLWVLYGTRKALNGLCRKIS